ncbi:CdaR family protein [Treponema sp. R6D11]
MNRSGFFAKITEKWPVKVLSLAAAIIIAIFYRMNSLETRFFTVPLLIESSDSLSPANSFPRSVKISARGEAEGIQPILAEDIEAYIDLGRYENEGTYRVPVQIRKKGRALGVEPLEISVIPVDIPLLLEDKITRNVSVFPVIRGSAAEGYELTNQSLTPSSVIVEGPRSLIDNRIEFNTETIDLDGRYEDFSIMVNIKNDNPLLSIHGSNILEFRGYISRIARETHENNTHQAIEEEHLSGEEQ